jgi:tetratricopeptide (TPR) repeat protein
MIKHAIFLIALLVFSKSLTSQQFDFNQDSREAYQHIIALRFEKGKAILTEEIKNHPDNLLTITLENYIDFFKVFISEDELLFEKLEVNKSIRLLELQKQPIDSPYYLWSQATINIQWAFARLKFGEYYTAAFELRRSFIQLEENERKYPGFLPNKLLLGLLHALVGSIPDDYQWIVKLTSMNGSVNQGIEEMKEVLIQCKTTNDFSYLQAEALFFLGFAELNLLAEPDDLQLLLSSLQSVDSTNLLLVYLKATIEMRTGNNDAAFVTLLHRPTGEEYYPFFYLSYLEAETMFRKLDMKADSYYRNFIISFHGKNYRQDAIRKLAWIGLLEGDTLAYKNWMTQIPKQPSGQVEADKQAVIEANRLVKPDVNLLKSRLLFDGGYYHEASQVLSKFECTTNQSEAVILEYYYRKGRVFHAMKSYDNALVNYQEVIAFGRNAPFYFAANAALKSGEIYEVKGEIQKAIESYKLCLSMKPDEYRSGIHQKAKAGINRLTEGK